MSGNILYFECYSGISGDMTVAALIDLGVDEAYLRGALETLPLNEYDIEIARVKKNGVDACDFKVILNEEGIKHHIHRNLSDVINIIEKSKITINAKKLALKIFYIVAEAEAKAHDVAIEDVHFHEVGAVDSIVDIVAAAVCLDYLKISDVVISEIYEGKGYVKCQHGYLPIPVPAVTNIVLRYKMPIKITANDGEMVTPTGIAIAAAIKTKDDLPESYIINAIGIGAGKREYSNANILRAYIIQEAEENKEENLWVIESNIDDCSGEALGYTMEKLFEIGVRDSFYVPIYMKKSRPAFMLKVICDESSICQVEDLIFRNTTTIGVRKYKVARSVLDRRIVKVNTEYGDCRVKVAGNEKYLYFYPEYEDVKILSNKTGIDYLTMYSAVKNLAEGELSYKNRIIIE